MKDTYSVSLRYTGKAVDDGSMPVQDVIKALEGFSDVYTKIASKESPESQHEIRIRSVEKVGSADIILEVWRFIGDNAGQIQAVQAVLGTSVIGIILGVIKLRKHIKGKEHMVVASPGKNTIKVKNSDNVSIDMPINVYQIYKDDIGAEGLNKMVQPLEKGKIDSAKVIAKSKDNDEVEIIEEDIAYQEKDLFETTVTPFTKTEEKWHTGNLNSLTKSTNKGTFYLADGTHVPYQLVGDNPERLYPFFLHKHPVKIQAIAELDENLKPILLKISDIEKTQGELFLDNQDEDSDG